MLSTGLTNRQEIYGRLWRSGTLANKSILFIIGSAEIGGTEKQTIRLARELIDRGWDARIWFTSSGGPLTAECIEFGIPFKVYSIWIRSPKWILRTIWNLFLLCRDISKFKPNLMQAQLTESILIYCNIFRVLSSKTYRVAGIRGFTPKLGFAAKKLFISALKNTSAVICNSPHLVSEIEEITEPKTPNISCIYNGVDISSGAKNARYELPRAVVISNLHPYKGIKVLIESLKLVKSELNIRICGSGPMEEEILVSLKENNLGERIEIVAKPANVALEIGNASFAIHPSETEGMSNAILEEIAGGLPVIACDVGGNYLLVKDLWNGFLISPGDATALALAIDRLASDSSLREEMGKNSTSLAYEFGWANCVSNYEKIYLGIYKQK